MEATAVSIGKSVLKGALGYAKSAVVEEAALQLGVQHDKAFIADELEMMQSFLMVVHDERDEHNKVIKTWVKQVRDVAYDVEDGLQDFVVCTQKRSWWRIPSTLRNRRHVANQMKELRAKVEEVSQRNVRYRLIKGTSSTESAVVVAAAMFGVDEASHVAKQQRSRSDLAHLINNEGGNQNGVIGVWGTNGSVGHTSIIMEAYENPDIKLCYPCRAWVRVVRPFHPTQFVQSMVKQFHSSVGVGVLLEGEKTGQELAQEFNGYVNEKRCLIVLTDMSTIEEWHQIKTCFPENKLGSQIIVSTEHVEVASLCSGQESIVSELKQLSTEQTIYAFYQQSSQDVTSLSKPASSSTLPCIAENEIQEDQSNINVEGKMIVQNRFRYTNTMAGVLEEFQLIGREKEKIDITELILEHSGTQQFQAIAVWGMGGVGKTTLIKDIYQSKEVNDTFGKHAFVTVLRPFKLEELLRNLALQLDARKGAMDFAGDTQKSIASMGVSHLTEVLGRRSQGKSCLIVLDDLSSIMEWDKILPSLLAMKNPSLVIVITTRREDIAKHCCKKPECIRLLNGLQEKDACNLFTKRVFKNKTTDLAKHYPELVQPAKLILKKCNGLPLAIVTIGGFLADQSAKTTVEWRKLNEHISVELEMNPKFEVMKTVLLKSYDGLPYYLKSCLLYMSIFPEDVNVSRRRLVRRWIAEGYSQDIFVANRYFMELIERSMILPTQQSVCSIQGFDSCQLHDLIRDISSTKSTLENIVFTLEEGCSSNTHGVVRHLAISSNWEGDERELESTVELSRIRSLTVFGKWRPFYISDKMRFLRVLDLEGTEGLTDRHLEHIGKHLHLRYLSLRWCLEIWYLPDSVGNLRQLETLDIKGTRILTLPKTITKLTRLRYLKVGNVANIERLALSCCVPWCMRFNCLCGGCPHFSCFKEVITDHYGVKVPRGIGKLKTLHTLRSVHLERGNAVIQEIKCLTGLHKLGVFGISMSNGPEFCSAISSLNRLESWSVRSEGDLYDCLHGMSSPPEKLQTLKLHGYLKKLPEWIKGLQNLVKLSLERSELLGNGEAMQVIGNLPNLSIFHLMELRNEESNSMTFQSGLFRSLVVLHLVCFYMKIESMVFEGTSMPKLEVLSLRLFHSAIGFSGLELLPSIKEVQLLVEFDSVYIQYHENMTDEGAAHEATRREHKVKEDIEMQLSSNINNPILKLRNY